MNEKHRTQRANGEIDNVKQKKREVERGNDGRESWASGGIKDERVRRKEEGRKTQAWRHLKMAKQGNQAESFRK